MVIKSVMNKLICSLKWCSVCLMKISKTGVPFCIWPNQPLLFFLLCVSGGDPTDLTFITGQVRRSTGGMVSTTLQLSAQTTSSRVQAQIEHKLVKRGRDTLAGPRGKKVLCYILSLILQWQRIYFVTLHCLLSPNERNDKQHFQHFFFPYSYVSCFEKI